MTIKKMGKGDELVAVEYLAAMQELAFERGIEPRQMLRDTDLPMDIFIREGVKIGAESIAQVMLNCPELLADPMLPYDYARRLTLSRHGTLGFALNSCKNLGEAIVLLSQYMGIRVQSFRLQPQMECDPPRVVMVGAREGEVEIDESLLPIAELFTVAVLCCLGLMAKQFIGELYDDREICVHTLFPDRGVDPMQLQPPLQIVFGSDFNGLVCPAALLSRQPPLHNETMSRVALAKCEQELREINALGDSLSNRVRELLVDEASGQWRTVEEVAALVFMSPTSLKRKLAKQDSSFQRIKNSERFNRAIQLLEQQRLTLDNIADQLGYDNASNFSKAFKNWTGQSPKDYLAQRDH